MIKRRVGAIARYKAAVRKMRRERAAGPAPTPPVGLFSEKAQALRDGAGNYRVHQAGQIIAGPFDTRDEAQRWIDER